MSFDNNNDIVDNVSVDQFLKDNHDKESLDNSYDSYEKKLDKEIETNCNFSEYVDKLHVDEKPYEELLKMEKNEILDFKDYQIKKYKAYINSLEQEKQDLIENFKDTTNILLEKIKELEEKKYGERPQTAVIMNEIKKNPQLNTYSTSNNSTNYSNKDITNIKAPDNTVFVDNKQDDPTERCVKCKKYFTKNEFPKHSITCLRQAMIQCKICKESLSEENKEKHIYKFRNTEDFLQAIKKCDNKTFEIYIGHGYDISVTYDENEYYPIHYIIEYGTLDMLKIYIKKKFLLTYVDKMRNSPLVSYFYIIKYY